MRDEVLDCFRQQGEFTEIGSHGGALSNVAGDVGVLVQIVQGLLLHDGFAARYRLEHVAGLYHYVGDILDRSLELDPRPITVPRSPERRVQVCCRDYAVLLTALLRDKGIPARARCGFAKFGANEEQWFDHWICEYWDASTDRWIKVDAQLNPHLRQILDIRHDPYDVPDDLFIAAGEAWLSWRRGKVEPDLFTIHDLSGSWLIRGNLLRDFAAANKVEIEPHLMRINLGLTWDPWRLMAADDSELCVDDWQMLDRIAELTLDVDQHLPKIRALYRENAELRPPARLYERVT